MAEIVIGVKSIKRGPIPDDGTMGTVLSKLGDTYKDTASFIEADKTVFNVMVEENDDPDFQFLTKGAKTLSFSLIDHAPAVLQAVLGGTISEVDGAWEEPDSAPTILESYQVITQTGHLIEIPKGSVTAIQNDALKKGDVGLIAVKVTPLKPDGLGVKAVRRVKYQQPTVDAGADQPGIVADHANLVGTATAFRGDVATKVWTCTSKPVGAPDPGITTPAALATAVTGLVSGVYKFTLTVSDENDYTNSDSVTITAAIA